MKKKITAVLILLFPIILFCQNSKKILLIGIDGCRSDALQIANTPHIDDLIDNGIFAPDALNDDITISGPGWSAILCGVWSDKHLVTGNNFDNNNYNEYPPFFKYIDDFDSTLHSLSICHWAPINEFIIQDFADFKFNVSSDLEVAAQASSYIALNDPDVIFLHFDDIDHAGHSFGFSPIIPEYITAIEDVDNHIGTIIQSVKDRPTYALEDWLILISTDHGGLGFSHGGNSIEEQNVFVIASGNNVIQDTIFRDSSILSDSALNCLGDSTELKFDGVDDYVNIPPNSLFNFNTDQDFTIECRVRTTVSADVSIIGNKDWNSGFNKGFVFSFKYPSGPEWKVNIGDGVNRADINTGGEIADNEWHTLSVSFDRDGWMKMYQDGAILDSTDISSIGDINTNEGLIFGTDINGSFDYSGAIAEVRVWDAIINEQDIGDWYCTSIESIHPNFDNLIAYWKLNEGLGNNEVTDYSINGNNGNITGASWVSPDSIVVYDYSSTRRQTDILPTALRHLCIPIEEEWGLDGTSLIPECNMTSIENQNQFFSKPELQLFPNPAKAEVHLSLKNIEFNHPIILEVYHSIGTKIFEQEILTNNVSIDISDFNRGIYFFMLKMKNNKWITKKLIKIADE